jgi:hypothetical protein
MMRACSRSSRPRPRATGAGISQDESTGLIGPGAAYVFRHTGEARIQEARLTASNSNDGDRFGSSVALWGDALIVGAQSEDSAIGGVGAGEKNDDAYHSGAAYLFRRGASGWTETAYIKAPEPKVYEAFGASAAVYEDIIVIGAPVIDDISGPEFPGSVYIYQ